MATIYICDLHMGENWCLKDEVFFKAPLSQCYNELGWIFWLSLIQRRGKR